MTEKEAFEFADKARSAGFAVVIFTPEEIEANEDIDADSLEEYLVTRGNEYISQAVFL